LNVLDNVSRKSWKFAELSCRKEDKISEIGQDAVVDCRNAKFTQFCNFYFTVLEREGNSRIGFVKVRDDFSLAVIFDMTPFCEPSIDTTCELF
jgi:hypothetical protein